MPDRSLLTVSKPEFSDFVTSLLTDLMSRNADAWEKDGRIPREVWKGLANMDLFRLPVTGPEVWRTSLFLQHLGYFGYGGIRSAIGVAAFMAPYYLENFGSEHLKLKYLQAIRNGDCIPALAISEGRTGSDLRTIECTGKLEDRDLLVIDGQKSFIANGRQADIFITLVKTEKTISMSDLAVSSFIVVENTPGCVSVDRISTLAWQSADVCQVKFNRCFVCAKNIIGRPNSAMMQIIKALNFERLVAGTLALGSARRAIAELTKTAMSKQIKGKPLGANQAVSHAVANHTSILRMIDAFNDVAWSLLVDSEVDTITASSLKLRATELEMAVAQDLLRFKGASGFEIGTYAARFYRDAIAGTIAAGPNELMRDIIYDEECEKLCKSSAHNSVAIMPSPPAMKILATVAGE